MQENDKNECKNQFGGAALEYILVSTFAAAICIAALSFMAKTVQEKLQSMGEKLGLETSPSELDWLIDRQ